MRMTVTPEMLDEMDAHKGSPERGGAMGSQVGGTHYKDMVIQPAEFITKNGLGFLEGCVVKRMCRWQRKNGIEDLRKAIHEIELLIEMTLEPQSKWERK